MKPTLEELFHFTRSERRGVIFLSLFVILLFLIPSIYTSFQEEGLIDYSVFQGEIDTWEAGLQQQEIAQKAKYAKTKKWKKKTYSNSDSFKENKKGTKEKSTSFSEKYKKKNVEINAIPFNPNIASEKELLALGIPSKTVTTLLNFRNKGGKFYKKEDLKKVYGFKEGWYNQLEDYIIIEKKRYTKYEAEPKKHIAKKIPTNYDTPSKPKEQKTFKKKVYKPVTVNINTANAEEFQKIYGIGPAFSKRMVKFRENLGGYHSIQQIAEVYGLADSTFQKIKPSLVLGTPTLTKININIASVEDFKKHPYLKWRTAKAIVKYRKMHGNFATIDDLKKCHAVKTEIFEKIRPYLSAE